MKKLILCVLLFNCGGTTEEASAPVPTVPEVHTAQAIIQANPYGGLWDFIERDHFASINTVSDHIELPLENPFHILSYSVTVDNGLAYEHFNASVKLVDDGIEIYINKDGLTGYYNPTLLESGIISVFVSGE